MSRSTNDMRLIVAGFKPAEDGGEAQPSGFSGNMGKLLCRGWYILNVPEYRGRPCYLVFGAMYENGFSRTNLATAGFSHERHDYVLFDLDTHFPTSPGYIAETPDDIRFRHLHRSELERIQDGFSLLIANYKLFCDAYKHLYNNPAAPLSTGISVSHNPNIMGAAVGVSHGGPFGNYAGENDFLHNFLPKLFQNLQALRQGLTHEKEKHQEGVGAVIAELEKILSDDPTK